jgi:hypothetical protein
LSRDPDLLGRILASTLCRKGKIKEATDLVTEMCARNPTFDIRAVQGEGEFQDCVNDPRVSALFEPALSVTENHGAVFNDVTVTNGSAYRVTNVRVRVQVVRQGGKSDAPFSVAFPEIAAGTAQSQNGVFKNAGWFGGDVERVDAVVLTCDQQFERSRTVAKRERRKAPTGIDGCSRTDDGGAPVDWRTLFSGAASAIPERDTDALVNQGRVYANSGDYATAVKLFGQAAEGGSPDAMYEMSKIWAQGLYWVRDPDAAELWRKKAEKARREQTASGAPAASRQIGITP